MGDSAGKYRLSHIPEGLHILYRAGRFAFLLASQKGSISPFFCNFVGCSIGYLTYW
jgi:hypothetical protein